VSAPATNRQVSLELDVLRGFAAVLMIVNHAGLQWLSARDAQSSLSGALVFLGSLAPVVFFFVTGFGTALSAAARSRPAPLAPIFLRSGLLVVADQFFAWTHGTAWGLDFFSFIALTVLVVGLLSRLERPVLASAALAGALLVLRYVVGPALTRSLDLPPFLDWVVGVRGVEHVSYPLSPWLVYPLLGLVAGHWYAKSHRDALYSAPWIAAIGMASMAMLAASLWLDAHGHELFRWGTVSSSFVLFSWAVLLALSIVSALLAERVPRVAACLALSGIASFALIPLHYALIGYGSLALSRRLPLAPGLVGVLVLALLAACFTTSKSFAYAMQRPFVSERRRWLYPLLLIVLAGMVALVLIVPTASPAQGQLEAFVGQMIIAALLAMRAASPRKFASASLLRARNSA
jgi:uncharacterized membrane protein